MTICPIALAVGCKKCPAFKFCPLTTVLGDQEEKDEIDPSNKVWEESFPTADEHLDKTEDEYQKYAEQELEKLPNPREAFEGEYSGVIPEKKKLTKDERIALLKKSAEKKSADDID